MMHEPKRYFKTGDKKQKKIMEAMFKTINSLGPYKELSH